MFKIYNNLKKFIITQTKDKFTITQKNIYNHHSCASGGGERMLRCQQKWTVAPLPSKGGGGKGVEGDQLQQRDYETMCYQNRRKACYREWNRLKWIGT